MDPRVYAGFFVRGGLAAPPTTMTILDPVAAQAVGTGTPATTFLDPLFLLAVVGAIALLWGLIRFIFDDTDLHGNGDDFGSHLSGRPTPRRDTHPSGSRPEGRRTVHRLPPVTPPDDPRHLDHRGRPAA